VDRAVETDAPIRAALAWRSSPAMCGMFS